MPLLSENLAMTMELDKGAENSTSVPVDTTLTDFTYASSMAPSSSRSRPLSTTLVPLSWVQRLEAMITT